MVTDASDGVHRCDVCGLRYDEEELAARCERFCREHDACDPDIIARSLDT